MQDKCVQCGDLFPFPKNKWKCDKCQRERERQYAKRRYQEKKEQISAKVLKRYHENKEAILAKATQKHLKRKLKALEVYGKSCACCGVKRHQFLTFHHSLKDGKAHREKLKVNPGSSFLYRLEQLGWPNVPGLVVLCANCHLATDLWGECPHQKDGRRKK